jgi:hypothetical protein
MVLERTHPENTKRNKIHSISFSHGIQEPVHVRAGSKETKESNPQPKE